jgi:hypothetical protein
MTWRPRSSSLGISPDTIRKEMREVDAMKGSKGVVCAVATGGRLPIMQTGRARLDPLSAMTDRPTRHLRAAPTSDA